MDDGPQTMLACRGKCPSSVAMVNGAPFSQPTHDDRLLSTALIAELDRLLRAGDLSLGLARSAVIPPPDPFGAQIF